VKLSHGAVRELLAAHALDATDLDERQSIERHTEVCPGCRDELDQHRAVAALIGAQSVEVDVPESLWDRVQAGIAPESNVTVLRPGRTPLLAVMGIAAAMFLLVIVQTSRLTTVQSELVAAQVQIERLHDSIAVGDWSMAASLASQLPGARSVSLTGGGSASIILLPDGTGFVTTSDLSELPGDRAYQLWIVQRGEVVSAGLLRAGAVGSTFRYDPTTLDGLVVTEEVAAGVVVSDGPAVVTWFDT
jgi:hypothetical protein